MSNVSKELVREKGQGGKPLSADELRKIDGYWRACNYLCVGMLYLRANPVAGAFEAGAHKESVAGTLGIRSGTDVCLGALEPLNQEI